MSVPNLALGGPLGDALSAAQPAAAGQLQQLALPGLDGAAKAAALKSQAEQSAGAQAPQGGSAVLPSASPAEAATTGAAADIDKSFSSATPLEAPAVSCGCASCRQAASALTPATALPTV